MSEVKSSLVDVSVLFILTGATDANPVNEVVQFLSDFLRPRYRKRGGQTT